MKRDCPKRSDEKENKRKYGKGIENKHAAVTGGAAPHHVHFTVGRPVGDRLQ